MSENTYKISAKFGPEPSFEVEGPQDAAREDFRAFMDKAEKIATINAAAPPASPAVEAPPKVDPLADPAIQNPAAAAPSGVDAETMARTYISRDGVVTLAALPQGENAMQDAMLLCLYGFAKQTGATTVTAIMLARALRLSGLPSDRIDREAKSMIGTFMTKAGMGRATRYGATNSGMKRAEDILRVLHA